MRKQIQNIHFPVLFPVVVVGVLLLASCGTEPTPTYTITTTASPAEGGSVAYAPSGSPQDEGTSLTFTATPAEGYLFSQWEGDIAGISNPITVTLKKDLLVQAAFGIQYMSMQIDTVFFHFPEYDRQNNARMSEFDRSVYFVYDGVEHLVGGGVDWWDPNKQEAPLYHFYKPNGRWEFLKLYDVETSEFRNYEYFTDGTGFLTCDHGPEWRVPENGNWPLGHMYVGIMQANNVAWNKVSTVRSFYHDCSYGDLNQDGIGDVIGGHFGNGIQNLDDNPHIYFGKSGYEFEVQMNVMERTENQEACCHDVEIFDIDDDGINELIRIEFNDEYFWFDTYQYNSATGKFDFETIQKVLFGVNQLPELYDFENITDGGQVNTDTRRYTKKRLHDFNNDGKWDFSTHIPSIDHQVLVLSNGDGYEIQTLSKQGNIDRFGANLSIKDFDVFDLENDGDPDVVLRAYYQLNDGSMDLSRVIFINDNGVMKALDTDKLIIYGFNTPKHAIPFVKDNFLHFHGWIDFVNINGEQHTRISTIKTSIPASNWYEE